MLLPSELSIFVLSQITNSGALRCALFLSEQVSRLVLILNANWSRLL